MNVNISVEVSHILVMVDGVYDQSDAMDNFRKAFDAARKVKIPRLLMDARKVVGEISTMERFEIGVLLSELVNRQADGPFTRIAIIGNELIVDPHRFVEIVAVNRGVQLKVTTDPKEALEWLEI